jgi:hypothetical protein
MTSNNKANKEMMQFYKELSKAGTGELRFEKMRNEFLFNILEEIISFTDDPLVRRVCENSKDRTYLDGLIHARKLFPNLK